MGELGSAWGGVSLTFFQLLFVYGPWAHGPRSLGPLGPIFNSCWTHIYFVLNYLLNIFVVLYCLLYCPLFYLRTPCHQAPHPHLPPQWLRAKGLGLWVGGGFGLKKCGVGEDGLTDLTGDYKFSIVMSYASTAL